MWLSPQCQWQRILFLNYQNEGTSEKSENGTSKNIHDSWQYAARAPVGSSGMMPSGCKRRQCLHTVGIFGPHYTSHELMISLSSNSHEPNDRERKHELLGRVVGAEKSHGMGHCVIRRKYSDSDCQNRQNGQNSILLTTFYVLKLFLNKFSTLNKGSSERNKHNMTSIPLIKKKSKMSINNVLKDKLIYAVRNGNVEVVKCIISDLPSSFRKPLIQVCSLIRMAFEAQNLEIAKLLIGSGLLPNDICSVIHSAITHGDLESVKMLQEMYDSTLTSTFNEEASLVTVIAKRFLVDEECSKILDHLLEDEKNIDKPIRKDGYTLLHLATEYGNVGIVSLIINKKCNINITTIKDQTAVHIAALNNHLNVVSLLLKCGAKFNEKDKENKTPLDYAIEKSFVGIIEMFLNFILPNLSKNSIPDYDVDNSVAAESREIVQKLLNKYSISYSFEIIIRMMLLTAVENEHLDVAKFILEKTSIRNAKHHLTGNSVLHIACEKGDENICKLLLKKNANPLALNNINENPLHSAAKGGNPDIISDLLETSSSTDIFTKGEARGYSPYHIAIENSQEEAVKFFINRGFDADDKTDIGINPLDIAAYTGHAAIVLLLLKEGNLIDFVTRIPVNIRLRIGNNCNLRSDETFSIFYDNREGTCLVKYEMPFTPLYVAAYYGHGEVVRTFLKKRANANVCFHHFLTPLHAAAQRGHLEIVEQLIRKGAKVNICASDKVLSTPLVAAAQGGHKEVVELLLQFNADANASLRPLHEISKGIEQIFKAKKCQDFTGPSYIGYTSLHFAVKDEDIEMVQMLLKCGADANAKNDKEITPLHLAVSTGNISIINKLINAGARFDSACKAGLTPFFYAVQRSNVEILKTLLIRGAPFETHTRTGKALLYFAMDSNCDKRMIQYLICHGASVNVRNESGSTLLHQSFEKYEKKVIFIKKFETPVEWELYTLFVENCFDVDFPTMNKTPETALSMACRLGRANEVEFLLKHNADINKEDYFGIPPLVSAVKKIQALINHEPHPEVYLHNIQEFVAYTRRNTRHHRNCQQCQYDNIFQQKTYQTRILLFRTIICSIVRVIARRKASNEAISSKNDEQVNDLFVRHYYDICMYEIEKMKSFFVTDDITLFDILVKSERKLSLYAYNNILQNYLLDGKNLQAFPEYSKYLRDCIERGLKRKALIEKSLRALETAFNARFPVYIAYEMFDYFKTIELVNLCRACLPFSCETLDF